MVNIFGGFRATSIFPFNPLAIQAEVFGPSKTCLLASVTSRASEGEIPSADKMPVSVEQPTQVPQSSSSVPEDFTEVPYLPTVVKEPARRKTKIRVWCFMCYREWIYQ